MPTCTIPQIETFRRDNLTDLDTAVNKFVADKYEATGFAPILKPHANGCTVIWFKRVEAPPVANQGLKFVPSKVFIGADGHQGPPNHWPNDLDHNRDRNRYGGRY